MNTYKCPACQSEDVTVMAQVSVRPTEFGGEGRGELILEHDDSACCNSCEWTGVMSNLILGPMDTQQHW